MLLLPRVRLQKMKKMIFLLACTCFIFSACKKDLYLTFVLKNGSQKRVTYSYSLDYPDTSLKKLQYGPGYDGHGYINPGDSGWVGTAIKVPLENPQQVLQLFVFDEQVLRDNSWDSIVSKYMILKRFTRPLDSIRNAGSIFTYAP